MLPSASYVKVVLMTPPEMEVTPCGLGLPGAG
jgi:hypothetical protein